MYLPVIRNNVYDFFQLLDFPDPAVPSGDRSTTTVAPQALLMMNSELVQQAAADLSARLSQEYSDPKERHVRLYQLAFGRNPVDSEREQDFQFLEQLASSQTVRSDSGELVPWTVLCHTILASSEFIYIR